MLWPQVPGRAIVSRSPGAPWRQAPGVPCVQVPGVGGVSTPGLPRGACRFPGAQLLTQAESWPTSQRSGNTVRTGKVNRQILTGMKTQWRMQGLRLWGAAPRRTCLSSERPEQLPFRALGRTRVPKWTRWHFSSSRPHLAAILISASHSCSWEQLEKVIFLYLKYRTREIPVD